MNELRSLMLQNPPWSLAVAESMSSGLVQAAIGATSGASDFFRGGVTAYTIDEKVRLLGVDRGEADRVNAVSSMIAEQMARGASRLFDSDWAIATTGYAEPSPTFKIADPLTDWAIFFRGDAAHSTQIWSGRLTLPDATRLEAQRGVANYVVAQLVGRVREMRASPTRN